MLGGLLASACCGAGAILAERDSASAAVSPAVLITTARTTRTNRQRLAVDPLAVVGSGTNRPWVALTFDDGPDPDLTPRVLAALEGSPHRATFFVVASNAAEHPWLVREIVDAGHEVANHSGHHEQLDVVTGAVARASLALGLEAVRAAGSASDLLRPPWGRTSPTVTDWARTHGATQVFWTHNLDRAATDPGAGARLANRLSPGDVVLAHDAAGVVGSPMPYQDRRRTVAAIPALLERLDHHGLTSVTASRLIAAR